MINVVCFGEALVDMLSSRVAKGDAANAQAEQFTKYAGGAPANAAVAVARLGGAAKFVGMLGDDMFGRFLQAELQAQGVNTEHVQTTRSAKTGLAFVSLDEHGERSFEFYRPPAADLLYRPEHFDAAVFQSPGIFHVCTNSLTEDAIAETTQQLVASARAHEWLVSVDVNLRHNLWPEGRANRDRVNALLAEADVIKFSLEELEYLADGSDHFVSGLLKQRAKLILITDGSQPVQWVTANDWGGVHPPAIRAVDTTAGGDAFIGALLYQLAAADISANQLPAWLSEGAHERAIKFACACGAHAVSRRGAFVALPGLAEAEKVFAEHYPN
ncbi:carbohydrate kinase [Simiduia sp. 21SJ11W-1]|uniref:carbohydrate kinase family protein n=1 Tax=Simiduia sp. 21SJ11W-1 TaxID=2909669 RepID=UPI00209F6CB4|nr:carbohydrate kinase [Simiduia sp. 21SJ11W-1]UTA48305.1 carbohydrate kinase [Simiduia sp. 21SJ11W-1]